MNKVACVDATSQHPGIEPEIKHQLIEGEVVSLSFAIYVASEPVRGGSPYSVVYIHIITEVHLVLQ